MYCKNCNKMIPDGTTFCPYCGTPQQVQQNEPVGYQQDDSATVLVQDGNMGYPNGGFQPPVNPHYQQPVNPGYQAPVTPDYPQQGQNAGFQPQMPPVNPAFQQPAPQKKSKTGLIIGLVVGGLVLVGIIVGVLIAVFSADGSSYSESYNDSVISDDFLDDSYDDVFDDSNNDSYDDTIDDSYDDAYVDSGDNTADEYVNPEFEALFNRIGLELVVPEDFGSQYDYAAYASLSEYDELFLHEFAYIDDIVYQRVETVVYPASNMTDSEKEEFIAMMDDTYEKYDVLDCMEVNQFEIDGDFIVYELRYTDLTSSSAITELQSVGLLGIGNISYISFDKTVESLTSEGYVKR